MNSGLRHLDISKTAAAGDHLPIYRKSWLHMSLQGWIKVIIVCKYQFLLMQILNCLISFDAGKGK